MATIKRRKDISKSDIVRAEGKYFADPVNKRYPLDNYDEVRAAITYLARTRNQEFYTKNELKIIAKRVIKQAKKMGVLISNDSYLYQLAGIKPEE